MSSADEIIEQLESMPLEDRAHIVDRLLKTLNQSDPSVDAAWAQQAARRLDELRSGRVQGIPAEEVFDKARERFST